MGYNSGKLPLKAKTSSWRSTPGGHGDITQSHVAWKFARGLPYVSSPLYYDGRIYLIKTGGMLYLS